MIVTPPGFPFKLGCLLLLGLACLTACRTADQADSGQMASVVISGHSKAEIIKATAAAFLANGYLRVDDLTFEKKGSAWETANYGGWSSDRVWIKMRVEIDYVDIRKYALGCDAYVVTDHGVIGMEMEHKFRFAKRTEGKKILAEAKAALAATKNPSGVNRSPTP